MDEIKAIDPKQLLTEEGIQFLPNGAADPAQRLGAEALQALIVPATEVDDLSDETEDEPAWGR